MSYKIYRCDNLICVRESGAKLLRQLVMTYEQDGWWFFDCASKEACIHDIEVLRDLASVLVEMGWGSLDLVMLLEIWQHVHAIEDDTTCWEDAQ